MQGVGVVLIDHARWLRTLERSNAAIESAQATYHFNPLDREQVLGLAHRKGERVYDTVTGEFGVVIAGTRKRLYALPSPGGE